MKKAIIIGATSGIGQEVAGILVQQGWRIGIAGRRKEVLRSMQQANPQQIEIQHLDVTKENAVLHLTELIDRLGGMDLFFLSSGVGFQNRNLEPEIELNTARTNVEGFIRMVTAAFDYFKKTKNGHIAVISSIAGTKGLGVARMQHLNIRFTDIRPGFVATDLLRNGKYPMLMHADKVAEYIVRALKHKKRVKVIDGRYRLLVFFWRMIPRWLWERLPIKN